VAVAYVRHARRMGPAARRKLPAAALRLAGFGLAHASTSIEDGEPLCTLAVVGDRLDRARLFRYPAPTIEEGVDRARKSLAAAMEINTYAALVYEGHFEPSEGKDSLALVVELLGSNGAVLGRLVQPYRRRRFRIPRLGYARGFALVGQPMIDGAVEDGEIATHVLDGVRAHPDGPRLFRRAIRSRRPA
jgi:hypothetical protein